MSSITVTGNESEKSIIRFGSDVCFYFECDCSIIVESENYALDWPGNQYAARFLVCVYVKSNKVSEITCARDRFID